MKIFLIGMMGSGKSHWKQLLAKQLKTGGYDLDFIIESDEERTISEIFKEEGEVYFRKTEAKILRWFGEKKSFVLATGGGTPCFLENMNWMNQEGITIWLDESIESLVERLFPEKEHRPLISHLDKDEIRQFLSEKYIERVLYYSSAKYHLKGEAITLDNFKKAIKQHV